MTDSKVYGAYKGPYRQKSVKKRIEALFLDNLGKVLGREVILRAARDPKTKKEPENWHQRLSELRTDDGYTILSWRNRGDLKVQEYLMPHATKRKKAGKRIRPDDKTWAAILERAKHRCEWSEGGQVCGLHEGDVDPVGGGRVKLTPDHKNPHSLNPEADPSDPNQWTALCGRHQVTKKNYWDSTTGKMNTYAIVQFATRPEKEIVFKFLLDYFGYEINEEGEINRK
ncbi:MAG TPA: restriction endonuclease [Bacillota bacterium]|nr:restriction endonuclease [Verrucomicrobiota bacterium]OQC66611.1 MAG: Type-2 restriction enzyme KpnI [Verrucomicrobia bacterium ADurb.Bin006]HOI38643.1 restriction endonuclease [Bacillota bacterium]HQA42907.1 restriction endonuclease [Verrucomicrobiota bacterium]